jgi:electron transport complex protein RnfC
MKLRAFAGGIHPPDNKQWSAHKPIEDCPLSDQFVVPMAQHIGAPANPCVKVGDKVFRGQVIGEARGFVSVPVHAPTSGEVLAIEPRPHSSGNLLPAVVIRADGEDRWWEDSVQRDLANAEPEEIVEQIRLAGVVGMGGAAFPTHVKLSPPPEKTIDTLILNGVECEPYLTADHRLMLEETERLLEGLAVLQKVFAGARVTIGIEANKPDAIARLQEVCADGPVEVVPLDVKYPQGAEKQLIKAVTGREVPSGGLPMDIGVVVQNVGTVAAIADAVLRGRPLIERICTVTGSAVNEPKNLRIRIGMPLSHLVKVCGGLSEDPGKIILGGPMMGAAQLGLDVPTTRGTSGLLLMTESDLALQETGPCIRCARCVQACPANLLPTTIAAYGRMDRLDEAGHYRALDCIECGCCSYICPAAIPLVQTIRYAKGALLARKRSG